MPTLASISLRPSHHSMGQTINECSSTIWIKEDANLVHPTLQVQRPTKKGAFLIKTMPLIRYATQKTHIYDQDDTSLAAQLKRNVRVAVPAQAGSQPPVSNQTPLMHLYDRHPRSRTGKQPPTRLNSRANNRKPNTTPKCTARYEENQVEQKTATRRYPLKMRLTVAI